MIRKLIRATLWATPDPDGFEHRWSARVWMPVYLLAMLLAGRGVITAGSPVLDRVFAPAIVDLLGMVLVTASIVAFIGLAFPRIWWVEVIGLVVLVGMSGTYGAALLVASESDSSRDFLAWMIMATVVMPFSRLTVIGEQIKRDRA